MAVIVASVIYFRNPVSPLNAAGSALALLGAYLYTKASESKKSAAAPTAMTKADRSYSAYNEQFIQTTGLTGLTLEEFDV